MPASTEGASGSILASAEGRRAGRELLLETVFRPLSNLLVRPLARLHVPPLAVVLANAAAGLVAAFAIAGGSLVLGALLLQLKTLLDNTDGQLARTTGRISLAGRYLDTIADLVVNVAVFGALARATDRPLLAALGLAALTLVLAVDFNVSELAREAQGLASGPPPASGGRAERLLGGVYAVVFAPQDRVVRAVSERRLEAALGRSRSPVSVDGARLAYFDPFTLTALANLGLTTQLAVLGACLALGMPEAYLWLALASALALVPLQLRRESLVQRAARV
jgi:phosphatidylglycerophosphate synthase